MSEYEAVVQQWVPESMDWKECVAGEFATFDDAERRCVELRRPGRQAFVRNRKPPTEGK